MQSNVAELLEIELLVLVLRGIIDMFFSSTEKVIKKCTA